MHAAASLRAPPTWTSPPIAGGVEPGLALEEIEALRGVDLIAPPESLPSDASGRLRLPGGADRLRLPPPPVRAVEGYALFSAMGRVIARFDAVPGPSAGDEHAAIAEARLMSLVKGLHGLEQQIRSQMARAQRV